MVRAEGFFVLGLDGAVYAYVYHEDVWGAAIQVMICGRNLQRTVAGFSLGIT